MLVATAVSSINTRWAGSRDQESLAPESSVGARGRRRRVSALPPADFFYGSAMASKKSGKRAPDCQFSLLTKKTPLLYDPDRFRNRAYQTGD
jgi:hypothetical protein